MGNDVLTEKNKMIRVVVADDEYKICQLICQLINWKELNMKLVGIGSNGIEALKMIEIRKPDLLLTDIRMPGYNGLELLKRAQKINSNIEIIIISGYSDFEYAQTAIQCGVCDYILKPINRDLLNTTLQKIRQRFLEKQNEVTIMRIQEEEKAADVGRLRKTLWNDISIGNVPEKIEDINKKYYYHFEDGIFQSFMILTDVRDDCNIDEIYAKNVFELIPSKMLVYLQKCVQPFCIELETFYQNGEIYGFINYLPEKKEKIHKAFNSFINSLCLALSAFENLQLHLSTSNVFIKIEDLLKNYSQCEKAMGQRLLTEDIHFFENVPVDVEYDKDLLYNTFSQKIYQSLDIQNKNLITNAVTILESTAVKYGLNGCQMFTLVKKSYNLFLLSSIFCNEFHFKEREKLEDDFNRKALLCGSVKRLFKFLIDSCQKDLEEACTSINIQKNRPISQAKQYIQAHYSEALSLDNLSNQVGFSPSYFSTLFGKETGKTFTEYLTGVRIEEAKKLLRDSNIYIELICKMVGRNDSKRFSKTFKKVTGISPTEYRNLYS